MAVKHSMRYSLVVAMSLMIFVCLLRFFLFVNATDLFAILRRSSGQVGKSAIPNQTQIN